jgi:hypothetical protein
MTYYLNLEGRLKVNLDWWSCDAEKFHLPPSYVYHSRHLLVQSEQLFHGGKKQWPLFRITETIAWPPRSDQRQVSDVTELHIWKLPSE